MQIHLQEIKSILPKPKASKIIIASIIYLLFGTISTKAQTIDSTGVNDKLRIASHLEKNNPDSAIVLLRECDRIASAYGDSLLLMRIYNIYGVCYSKKSAMDSSLTYYFKALRLAEQYQDSLHIGTICNNIGVLNFSLNKLKEAEKFYKRAYDVFIVLNDLKWLAKVTGNYAGFHFMNKQYDTAVKWLKQSIAHGIRAQEFSSVASAYSNLAMILNALNRKEEAFDYFEVGLNMLDSIGNKKGYCTVLLQLAKLHNQQGNPQKAKKTFYRSIAVAEAIGYKTNLMYSHQELYKIYLQEDKDSALYCLNQYIIWKDSIMKSEELRIINDLEKQYNYHKQNEEIIKLQALKERDKARQYSQQLEIRNLWILSIAAIILILLIAFQLRSKQKNNYTLLQKNIIIQQALQEKETLMREINHRVKNNFQLVSSVLMIQASKIKDDTAKAVLMDTRNRIQSMSALHLRLYQNKEAVLQQVALQDFVEDLLEELRLAHAPELNPFQTEISAIGITMDKAIATGLILTEAVLNAFKHATKEDNLQIGVSIQQVKEEIHLIVEDNGPGFDELGKDSFGLKMIKNLVQKSSGSVHLENRAGAYLKIILPI